VADIRPPALERGVQDAVAPPPGNPRFPLFDSLRAIAALSVLLFHLGGLSHANDTSWWGAVTARLAIGVPIFFVISGFLLYRPFVTGRLGLAPRVVTRDYFRRRALRIIPAYWFALLLLGTFPGLPDLWTHDWWRYFLFAQSYSVRTVINGISPAWSLTAEVGFYLVLPAYAAFAGRLWGRGRNGLRHELLLLGVCAISAIALRTYIESSGRGLFLAFTLPGNADWFVGGMTLALLSAVGVSHRRAFRWAVNRPSITWLVAGGLFAVSCFALGLPRASTQSGIPNHYTSLQWLAEHVLYGVIAVAFVAPAASLRSRTFVSRILSLPPLPWLGLISYGIFLWHVPVMTYLCFQHPAYSTWLPFPATQDKLVVALAVTIAGAAVSYYLVERPFLRLKYGRASRRRDVEGNEVGIPVVLPPLEGSLADGDERDAGVARDESRVHLVDE
jgi:peptidoglycan/LPS O-acetylase OafA/YrhL